MKRIKRVVAAAMMWATVAVTVTSQPAAANLESSLKSMLGSNVQVNNGGAISTAKRGGFYGGSIYIRGRVTTINVLNFTPPSFASGCGGIDMFGGSFSMINKEQFVQLLRSIAQNAVGYAFQLALKNICEQCATIVAGLQGAIQAMNEFSGNSCQLAQGIVNSGIKAMNLSDVKGMQGTTIQEGWNDAWQAFWGSLSETTNALTATDSTGSSIYDKKYNINVVYEAMRTKGMTGWFPGGDKQLMEAVMTLTGTIVVSGPVKDGDNNPSRVIKPATSGANLTVRDLIYGSPGARFLRCTDTKCLMMAVDSRSLKGFVDLLEEVYVGSGPADTNSVLYKIVNGTGAEADASATKLIAAMGDVGGQIISIAKASEPGSTAAWTLFDRYKEYIAYELASRFVTEALAAVDQAVGSTNYDTAFADDFRRGELRESRERLNNELKTLATKIKGPDEGQTYFMELHSYLVRQNDPFNR